MKHLNSKASTVGLFFAATALLVFYLSSIRWKVYLPVALFWVAVALMLGSIVYQILRIELSFSYSKVVLLEIVVTCFVFHLIYQIPTYGLFGTDAYVDMASAKGILSTGFVRGAPQYITEVSYFPIIHVFGAISSMITGVELFSVAKWFPSFLDVVLILLLYLLILSIFKEQKIALLSVLLFACLENHILFSSLFIRETYALVLAVCCVYLYFSAKHSPHPTTNYVLSIMCLILTVFAHNLTGFMLMIFLLIHLLVTKASAVPSLRKAYFGDNIEGEKITAPFVLMAFVVLLAYWIFVAVSPLYTSALFTSPLYTLTTFVRSIFTPAQWGVNTYAEIAGVSGASIKTIRGYITFYGFYFFLSIFVLIILQRLLPRAKNRRVETYSFISYFFLCGVVGFLSLYIVAPAAYPDRFLTFGWLFGFAPLVATILKGKSKWLRRIGVFLMVAFMLFNIYMIPPSLWNARSGEIPAAPSVEDYALANTFNFSTGTILAPENSLMAIYDVHNNLGTLFTLSEVNQTKADWIIVQKEPNTTILAMLEGSVNYEKIYESSSLLVFKWR